MLDGAFLELSNISYLINIGQTTAQYYSRDVMVVTINRVTQTVFVYGKRQVSFCAINLENMSSV